MVSRQPFLVAGLFLISFILSVPALAGPITVSYGIDATVIADSAGVASVGEEIRITYSFDLFEVVDDETGDRTTFVVQGFVPEGPNADWAASAGVTVQTSTGIYSTFPDLDLVGRPGLAYSALLNLQNTVQGDIFQINSRVERVSAGGGLRTGVLDFDIALRGDTEALLPGSELFPRNATLLDVIDVLDQVDVNRFDDPRGRLVFAGGQTLSFSVNGFARQVDEPGLILLGIGMLLLLRRFNTSAPVV